ncbi:unnamed protein product [Rotaria sp. Silwood2]|nr:unnamed protein product [Rotaria sp. Silwood2]CAF4333060.1 unnamed protein product [Rotaria sp. Silwood2]
MSITNIYRQYGKWFGLLILIIESILLGGNIFGFSALFDILPKYDIYSNLCTNKSELDTSNVMNQTSTNDCGPRTEQYKLALTVGIWFYNLMPFFLGLLINYFESRFVKLIAIIFHIVGWLTLAFVKPGRDYLLFLHTVFTSISSSVILITGFAYCRYFNDGVRAVVSSIISGASISSTMWFSIFQVLITDNRISLKVLSIIWTTFGVIMFVTACFFMDWKFQFLNLPYKFATNSNANIEPTQPHESNVDNMTWYQRIIKRVGVWEHLLSPVYILVVLYLSFLLLPAVFLPVTWFPWVWYVTNENEALYPKQRIFNIALMQTITWFMAVAVCIIRMFNTEGCVIAAIILNSIERALIAGGCQAVVASFFPTEYLGTLTGVLWTSAAIISSIQYGLLPLTEAVEKSWRVSLLQMMASHWIHMWYKFFVEHSNVVNPINEVPLQENQANGHFKNDAYDNEITEDDPTRL